MDLVCCTKKTLKLPQSVRKDTRLFAHDLDELWDAGCSLGNLQPPLHDAQPQAVSPVPELGAALGAALCPTVPWGAGSHPKTLLHAGAATLASLDHAVLASRPATGNWGVTGPALFAKGTAPAPPGQSGAGSAEHQPSPLLRLLPFPSVLPLVFHRKDSVGFSCQNLGAGLAKGGPHAGRAPSLPRSSRRVL
uniref:Uncharacterized protein n=1 Tax=Athene cunicularia TaxID=194338 RepID=A0A663N504_ATHCN